MPQASNTLSCANFRQEAMAIPAWAVGYMHSVMLAGRVKGKEISGKFACGVGERVSSIGTGCVDQDRGDSSHHEKDDDEARQPRSAKQTDLKVP